MWKEFLGGSGWWRRLAKRGRPNLASPEMGGQQLKKRSKLAISHLAIQVDQPRTSSHVHKNWLKPVFCSTAPQTPGKAGAPLWRLWGSWGLHFARQQSTQILAARWALDGTSNPLPAVPTEREDKSVAGTVSRPSHGGGVEGAGRVLAAPCRSAAETAGPRLRRAIEGILLPPGAGLRAPRDSPHTEGRPHALRLAASVEHTRAKVRALRVGASGNVYAVADAQIPNPKQRPYLVTGHIIC